MLLEHEFPRYFILYQDTPNDINNPKYEIRHTGRHSRDLSASSREGRFLFKFGANQLQKLFLWSSFLANTAGTGTISTTNSFNLFGKTINSALSLAYGDRGFIPPVIAPPVPPVFPVVPPVPVLPPVPVVPPVIPVVPPVVRPPFPLVPFIPPVTTTANGVPPAGLPITARLGANIPLNSASVENGNPRITTVNRQADATSQRQIFEEYMELENRNKQLLSEYNNMIKQQQKIASNQNEQWRQFLKQHNLMVDKFNDRNYINFQRVNAI
jgi:hypothetical protein